MADRPLQHYPFTPLADRAIANRGWKLASGQGVEALAGADEIIGGNSSYPNDTSGLVMAGRLLTQSGADRIEGFASAQSSLFSFGIEIQGGALHTGSGHDSVLGSGYGGIYTKDAELQLGSGHDRLIGIGQGRDGLTYGLNLNDGTRLFTGQGDDRIRGRSQEGVAGFGVLNSGVVFTQAGDDMLIANSNNLIGLENTGSLKTGSGNDRIKGRGVRAAILNSGLISTGDGDDRVNGLIGGFAGDGSLHLGRGNDQLSGFGSGQFHGGDGIDTVRLPSARYLITGSIEHAQLMVAEAGGGSEVMFISGFERFAAGASVRTINAALEAGFVEFA